MAEDGGLDIEGVADAFPLTPAQAGMLLHSLREPGGGAYIGVFDAVLPEDVDVDRIRRVWATLAQRHEALRSVFVWEGLDAPLQVVRTEITARFEEESVAAADIEARLAAIQREGVDLREAPALRLLLLRRENGARHFVWACHHGLIDDWSARLVLRDAAALYAGEALDPTEGPTPPAPARTLIDWLEAQDDAVAEAHWRARLEGLAGPTRLLTPTPTAPPTDAERFGVLESALTLDATRSLAEAAKTVRATIGAVVQAAWGVALHRLAGSDDVVFGLATTLRSADIPGADAIVGNFVTTTPVRLRIDADADLTALIRRRQAESVSDLKHASLALQRIEEQSDAPRGEPLFDTVLSLEAGGESADDGGPFGSVGARDQSHYALSVLVWPGDVLKVRLLHDRRAYGDPAARLVLSLLLGALRALPQSLGVRPADLPVMDPQSKLRAQEGMSGPQTPPHPPSVEEAVAAIAREDARKRAVEWDEGALTYGALDAYANGLARRLRDRGLEPGDLIALNLARGPLAIIAMLAALKAGLTYAPLDPRHASERSLAMLAEAGVRLTLVDQDGPTFAAAPALPLSLDALISGAALDAEIDPRSPAYAIFTSGSTGAPKGVAVSRAALAASTAARSAFYDAPPERFLLLSSLSFDSSLVGIYWTLTTGGALILPGAEVEKDAAAIVEVVEDRRVTHTLGLPSVLALAADASTAARLSSLKGVIAAGEPLTPSTLSRIRAGAPSARIYNEYGPTEATVWCAAFEATDWVDGADAPIGAPIAGTRLVLRDRRGRPVPDGLPGELLIGGAMLAEGYLGQPDLTATCFVPDPAAPHADRLFYRTGDVARRRPDGLLEFLGRSDGQVKIRGFRVELGEVEATIERLAGVVSSVVKAFGDGPGHRLIAFVSPNPAAPPSLDALRRHAETRLPDWMRPSRYVLVDAFPKRPNGKIDRAALLEPQAGRAQSDAAPITPLEATLSAIWAKALWLDREVGVDEDFFELGGNSLLSMRLLNEIESGLGRRVSMAVLGRISTIRDQANRLERFLATPAERRAVDAAEPPQNAPPSMLEGRPDPLAALTQEELDAVRAYVAGWPGRPAFSGALIHRLNDGGSAPPIAWCFNAGAEFARFAEAMGPDQPVLGMRSGNLALDLSPETQQSNNRRLALQLLPDLLAAQPQGPYALGGNCQGAAVAMELALALQSLGREVTLVMLVEVTPVHVYGGRIALIFGRDSAENPFRRFAEPGRAWSRRYRDYSVDVISGRHGHYFEPPHLGELAGAVRRRLAAARKAAPTLLGADEIDVEWGGVAWSRAGDRSEDQAADGIAFAPQELCFGRVSATHHGARPLHPTAASGLRVALRWTNDRGDALSPPDGIDIAEPWAPGETIDIAFATTTPSISGPAKLVFELVEEGMTRFEPPATFDVTIDPSRPASAGAAAQAIAQPKESPFADPADAPGARGEQTLDALAAKAREAPDVFLALGRAQVEAGDIRAAIRSFEQAVALSPQRAAAHFALGRALLDTGRPAEALAALRQGLRLSEDAEHRALADAAALQVSRARRIAAKLWREIARPIRQISKRMRKRP